MDFEELEQRYLLLYPEVMKLYGPYDRKSDRSQTSDSTI